MTAATAPEAAQGAATRKGKAAPVLQLSRDLALPIDLVTRKTAILAKSGAGKSNTAKVIVEGVVDAGAQVVIFDPVGHWWGLRSLFPIPVLGGMNGDIPLDPLAGKLIADVAAESGQSLILDVSLMDSDGEMQRFAYEFAERFYKQKQLHPTAVLVVLEEADEFAPQDTRGPNVPRMVGAWARIAKRGRGRGIGLLSVTLRSAALSKNVLNQSDGIVAMRTTAPLDIKAVKEWVAASRAVGADEVIPSLPGLETGEAWFWIPEDGVLERVKVLKARSLDTSATPEVGAQAATVKKLKPIDLAALGERMQSTVEKAKENDPDELRARLAAAEQRNRDQAAELHGLTEWARELATVDGEDAVEAVVNTYMLAKRDVGFSCDLIDEVRALRDRVAPVVIPISLADFDAALKEARAAVTSTEETFHRVWSSLNDTVDRLAGALLEQARSRPLPAPQPRPAAVPARVPPAPPPRQEPAQAVPASGALSRPQQKILDALAWWETVGNDQPTRGQLAFVAGYAHPQSRGFRDPLYGLKSAELIDYPEANRVALTPAGSALAARPSHHPTEAELQEMIYARIGANRAKMLRLLVPRRQQPLTRDALAAELGYAHAQSRGFRDPLYRLHALDLVVYPSPGLVAASSLCYLDA